LQVKFTPVEFPAAERHAEYSADTLVSCCCVVVNVALTVATLALAEPKLLLQTANPASEVDSWLDRAAPWASHVALVPETPPPEHPLPAVSLPLCRHDKYSAVTFATCACATERLEEAEDSWDVRVDTWDCDDPSCAVHVNSPLWQLLFAAVIVASWDVSDAT
jgi:hypothetical protein